VTAQVAVGRLTRVRAVRTHRPLAARLGVVAALLTAICPLGFLVFNLAVPSPAWRSPDAYIAAFDPAQMLWMIPTLMLAPIFVVLIACIHASTANERKVLALIGLIFATVYATVESANYLIQLMVVRPSILAGQGQGVALLFMPNPNGLFSALELLGYVFQLIGILFVAFAFTRGGLEQWVRWSLIGVPFGALPLAGLLAFAVPPLHPLGFATISTDLWAVFLLVAGLLLVLYFNKPGPADEAP
jgi:hypothetical protein